MVFHAGQWGVFDVPRIPILAQGVTFFFVLSGFILTLVYKNLKTDGMWNFYVARVARIWPIHALTLVLVLVFFANQREFAQTSLGFFALIANAFLFQSFIPVHNIAISYNGVSWSISTEFFFYLIFPVLAIPASRSIWGLVFILIALYCVGLISALGFSSPQAVGWARHVSTILYTSPIVRGTEFVVGIFAARLYLNYEIGNRNKLLWSAVELTILAVAFFVLYNHQHITNFFRSHLSFAFVYWWQVAGFSPLYALVVLIFAHARGYVSSFLSLKPIVLMGEASFAGYMLHQIVYRIFVTYGFLPVLGAKTSLVIALLVIFTLSIASFLFFETPIRRRAIARFGAPSTTKTGKVD